MHLPKHRIVSAMHHAFDHMARPANRYVDPLDSGTNRIVATSLRKAPASHVLARLDFETFCRKWLLRKMTQGFVPTDVHRFLKYDWRRLEDEFVVAAFGASRLDGATLSCLTVYYQS